MNSNNSGANLPQRDISSPKRSRTRILSRVLAIPVIGEAFRICNAYTYDGDIDSDYRIAPLSLWIQKHWSMLVITVALTMISCPPDELLEFAAQYLSPNWVEAIKPNHLSPGVLIVSIFPNLLGFGIGVYALIFSLSAIFVRRLHEQLQSKAVDGSKALGSALMLNADMAYPLLAMALTVGIAVLQQIYPESRILTVLTWAALWYSLLMALEILNALYGLGENELLTKISAAASLNEENDKQ